MIENNTVRSYLDNNLQTFKEILKLHFKDNIELIILKK